MRKHFFDLLANKDNIDEVKYDIETFMYMSLWYALLYTVIEGWQELKLNDANIDSLLLEEENIHSLKMYRNGAFHFQKDYDSRKFRELDQNIEAADWMTNLNREFGRFFIQELTPNNWIMLEDIFVWG